MIWERTEAGRTGAASGEEVVVVVGESVEEEAVVSCDARDRLEVEKECVAAVFKEVVALV